jgi:hypothetical protein
VGEESLHTTARRALPPLPASTDEVVPIADFVDYDSDEERVLQRLKRHSLRTMVADEAHRREKENTSWLQQGMS